jgi:Beta-1,3-glucanase
MKLTIVNNTGLYQNDEIYFYVLGLSYASPSCYCHLEADGSFTECSLNDNGPDGYTDYSIGLNASGGETNIELPEMYSGQIYFSFGEKLNIAVNSNPTQPCGLGLALPSGWTPSDPNYNILYADIEFTYTNTGVMNCDTTYVDMFTVPITMQLIGQQNQTVGQLVPGGFQRIYEAFAANDDFKSLIVGNNLRVIAPGHGIDAGLFSSTYLDSYIQQCWQYYQKNKLTVNVTGIGAYTGQVDSNNVFTFEPFTSPSIISSPPDTIDLPATRDVFYCNNALSAPNTDFGAVVAIIGASLNRGVLTTSTTQPVCTSGDFYANAPTNYYSQILHANSLNGQCYGFPFDDVCGLYSSDISDPAPTQLILTLEALYPGSPSGSP